LKNKASSFKTYLTFCLNYENITKKIEELRTKDAFDEYLYERKYCLENTPGYSLESYLILPIQRIPRYELLLSDLLKNTPEDHFDFVDIQNSIVQIKNVARFVNQNLKYFKEKEKLREIVSSIKNLPKGLVRRIFFYFKKRNFTQEDLFQILQSEKFLRIALVKRF
jgi:FYVE, RhoGEF and PH domain containing 5/6